MPVTLLGGGQTFFTMAPSTLSFRSTAPINEFKEVQINGKVIEPSNYTVTEGSTIITLSTDYLKTLDITDHEITVVSKSGSPSAVFSVVEPKLNEYNFYYNQPYSADVEALGGTCIFFLREDGTMDVIMVKNGYTETGTCTVSDNTITTVTSQGTIPVTISEDGTKLECAALNETFVLDISIAAADEEFIYINDNSLGGYTATAIDKTQASYSPIRSDIDNTPVVALGFNAFRDNNAITSVGSLYSDADVKIPDSVTIFGKYVFRNCTSLVDVDFSNSLTSIKEWAFKNTGLTNITIDAPNLVIDYNAFDDCGKLTDINVLSASYLPGGESWVDCDNVKTITVGNVESLETFAFYTKYDIESITILDGVKTIEHRAFECTTSLAPTTTEPLKVTVSPDVTTIEDNAFYIVYNPGGSTYINREIIMYGEAGSVAEEYANNHDYITFVAI